MESEYWITWIANYQRFTATFSGSWQEAADRLRRTIGAYEPTYLAVGVRRPGTTPLIFFLGPVNAICDRPFFFMMSRPS